MNLDDYERQPGFQKRATLAKADVQLALATGKPVNLAAIARALRVPPNVAARWLGKTAADLGVTRARLSP